ncbi:MAG: hypothetical protein ABDK92_01575, partial [Atribacterota bacterium]
QRVKTYLKSFRARIGSQKTLRLVCFVFVLILATRLSILLFGYLGYVLRNNELPGIVASSRIIWERWDSSHYLWLAENWYTNAGEERLFIVFFPLYPLLIRLFRFVFPDYFLAGLMVSMVSLIVACTYLYKLVQLDYSITVARKCVKWVLIFPYTFFLSLVFTESLFLALSVLCFYAMRQKRWVIAGIFGLLASLTRNFGFFLLIPFSIEYLQAVELFGHVRKRTYQEIKKTFGQFLTGFGLIVLGIFLYLFLNRVVTGNWFCFLTYLREHWHQGFGFFAENIKNQVIMVLTWKPVNRVALWIPQLFVLLLSLICLMGSLWQMRLSYVAYMFTLLFISFSATWLLSAPRYTTTMFPLYIFLAQLSQRKILDEILTFFSLTMLCLYVLAYTWGMYVM